MANLVLPTFSMDCRDWLVVSPTEVGMSDEIAGAPLVAVLSTVVLGDGEFREASCVLSVGLMADDLPATREVAAGSVAAELIDAEDSELAARFVLPAPDGELVLLAEFTMPGGEARAVRARIEALMASFHWIAT
jgi:hypothetical protein